MKIQEKLKYLGTIYEISLPSDLWATMPDGVNREEVRKAYKEVAQRLTEYEGDEDELRDFVGEIADSCVPVYTHERWQEFNAFRLWASNEIEQEAGDLIEWSNAESIGQVMNSVLSSMLYALYSHAGLMLIEWASNEIAKEKVSL